MPLIYRHHFLLIKETSFSVLKGVPCKEYIIKNPLMLFCLNTHYFYFKIQTLSFKLKVQFKLKKLKKNFMII